MKNAKVRFKGWEIYKGWEWKLGGEGRVIAETETAYKIKTSWFSSTWVDKVHCEEIIS